MAGLSTCCGSRIRLVHTNKINVIMINTWVALLQLTTTPFFLIGWIWSVVWSTNFISISSESLNSVKPVKCELCRNRSGTPGGSRTNRPNLRQTGFFMLTLYQLPSSIDSQ